MTRARICFEHPGTVVRHHEFENFPRGATPHTTAPFDYAIVALAAVLSPFSARALDLAGAWISPLLALGGAYFLWWWMRKSRVRYGSLAAWLFAASPILAHGTELGRPDHQSAVIVLMLVAVCAELSSRWEQSARWATVAAIAWAVALWVSLYEPLLLLLIVIAATASCSARDLVARYRSAGWLAFICVLLVALAIERRLPVIRSGSPILLVNWSKTIGELQPVPFLSDIWFGWVGYLFGALPILVGFALWRRVRIPPVLIALLAATFMLTLWQARWAYFFALAFALTLPWLLQTLSSRALVALLFAVSCFPIMRSWDAFFWPNESERARRSETRLEQRDLRAASAQIAANGGAFFAPWWLSPAISYWSQQNGVAGSSHESIDGIVDTARLFATPDAAVADELIRQHKARWIVAYEGERVAANSGAVLGAPLADNALAFTLDRTPSHAPEFLDFVAQNRTCKLFHVRNSP